MHFIKGTHIPTYCCAEISMKTNILFAAAIVALSGCSTGSGHLDSSTTINTGRSDVVVKMPTDYSSQRPLPLVLLLHGYTSSGVNQDEYMKFSALVDEYQFILMLPDGTVETAGQKNRFWNATAACCDMHGSDVDDAAYLFGLISAAKKNYAVDENQVYLIGHSNGGFMSHRLAQDYPQTIAAIASLAGAAPTQLNGQAPNRPVSILQIHGTNDPTIKYAGGKIRGKTYPGAVQTMTQWAEHNGATLAEQELEDSLDLDANIAGKETTITRFDGPGRLELWTIQQGGHVPTLSPTFNRSVIEWLFAHPKRSA